MKQACFLMLELKRTHGGHDTLFDVLLRTLAEALCPPGNIMPPSLYLVEKLMQSRSTDSCSYHVCPKDHHIWPHIPRSQWQGHITDCCPIRGCGLPRFITETVAGTPCLRPSKVLCMHGPYGCTSRQSHSSGRLALVASCPFPALFAQHCLHCTWARNQAVVHVGACQ